MAFTVADVASDVTGFGADNISIPVYGGLSDGDWLVVAAGVHGFGGSNNQTFITFENPVGSWASRTVRRYWPGGGIFPGVEMQLWWTLVEDASAQISEGDFNFLLDTFSGDPEDQATVHQWAAIGYTVTPPSEFVVNNALHNRSGKPNDPHGYSGHISPAFGNATFDEEGNVTGFVDSTEDGDLLIIGSGLWGDNYPTTEPDGHLTRPLPPGSSFTMGSEVGGFKIVMEAAHATADIGAGLNVPVEWGGGGLFIGSWSFRFHEYDPEEGPPDPPDDEPIRDCFENDCEWEPVYLWRVLVPMLVSGDDKKVREVTALLEENERHLSDHLKNRPCCNIDEQAEIERVCSWDPLHLWREIVPLIVGDRLDEAMVLLGDNLRDLADHLANRPCEQAAPNVCVWDPPGGVQAWTHLLPLLVNEPDEAIPLLEALVRSLSDHLKNRPCCDCVEFVPT